MEISKTNNSYNSYVIKCSSGELQEFADALAKNHTGQIGDEMYNSIKWHLDNIPDPGESKEEFDARKEADKGPAPDEDGDIGGTNIDVDVALPDPGKEDGVESEIDEPPPEPPEISGGGGGEFGDEPGMVAAGGGDGEPLEEPPVDF